MDEVTYHVNIDINDYENLDQLIRLLDFDIYIDTVVYIYNETLDQFIIVREFETLDGLEFNTYIVKYVHDGNGGLKWEEVKPVQYRWPMAFLIDFMGFAPFKW